MEIYDQVDWNNGICNKNLRSFDVRKLKIQHTDILIIFYWFTGIGIHWRSVSAWWLLYSCEIRYGQNSTSKGVCKRKHFNTHDCTCMSINMSNSKLKITQPDILYVGDKN